MDKKVQHYSSVKDVLSHGYLHSNKDNFIRNYNELAKDDKYFNYVNRFYEETKNSAKDVLKNISSKAKDNQEILQNLIEINSDQIIEEGNKLLGKLELSFKGDNTEEIKIAERLSAGEFAQYMKQYSDCLNSMSDGSADSKDVEKIRELYEILNQFSKNGSYTSSTGKVKNSLNVTSIAGTLAEYLQILGIDRAKKKFFNSLNWTGTKTITGVSSQGYYAQTSGVNAISDLIINAASKSNCNESIPLGIQVKYQQDQIIRGGFGKTSWGFGNSNWQNFYDFLLYVVNNINVFEGNDSSTIQEDSWTKYTNMLSKTLIIRGVIQALITSRTNKGNKIDDMVQVFPDLMNVFSIIGGSGKKIKVFSNADVLKSAMDQLNFEKNGTEGSASWASFGEFNTFTDYIRSIQPIYGNELYRFTRAKQILGGMLGERAGNDFYSYVVGYKSAYKVDKKITRKSASKELATLIKTRTSNAKKTNVLPSEVWKELEGKYWFFGNNRKNEIDLRFDINALYK